MNNVVSDDELDDLLDGLDVSEDDAVRSSSEQTKKIIEALAKAKEGHCEPTSFPVGDDSAILAVDDPYLRLEELMGELMQHGNYQRIRQEYCELSILINLHGMMAPAFRPKLTTGKPYGDRSYNEIHRDQIVIDCHWLYIRRARIQPNSAKYRSMFKVTSPFSFALAWRFACEKWKGLNRAVAVLRLTPLQQSQLLAIQSPEMKQRIQSVNKGTRKDGVYVPSKHAFFEQGLNDWCERDKRILRYTRSYEAVWLARELLGHSASIGQVAELSALMLGEAQKDSKTIKSKEENIRRHIYGK